MFEELISKSLTQKRGETLFKLPFFLILNLSSENPVVDDGENPKLPSSTSFFPLLNLKPLPKNPLPFRRPPPSNTSSELYGLSLLVLSKDSLKNLNEENLGRATAYGPSRTAVGEGILVILPPLGSTAVVILQGGGSKMILPGPGMGKGMMSVQGRGLPGCSSHLNGTEAKVWSGGGGWSGEWIVAAGKGKNGNLSVEKLFCSVSSFSSTFFPILVRVKDFGYLKKVKII
ncbi:hypothetical protein CASFOL_041382 [Castilleja foliolosa]|uniref:Uncharacterized protein n=1 Tax=Castilleja foliolosa TaxID=1961234 RepID=A0ABD3BF80_9LAMI